MAHHFVSRQSAVRSWQAKAVGLEPDGCRPLTDDCPPNFGDVAQLGEHRLCKAGVTGSIPVISIKNFEASSRKGHGFGSVGQAPALPQGRGL
jgi:hypothetical protein